MAGIDINKVYTSNKAPSELLPPRDSEGHKGTFGKVLLIAGSRNMAGAAILAARAAYRSGAGMVKVISPECNRVIIQSAIPEALYMPSEEPVEEWQKAFGWCDVIGIGSGLGTDENARISLERALTMTIKPILIDADALNILERVLERINLNSASSRAIVLTPHGGELARLVMSVDIRNSDLGDGKKFAITAKSLDDMYKDLEAINKRHNDAVKQLDSAILVSRNFGAVVVAKSADTFVVDAGGYYSKGSVFLNDRGNSGMATAGSGDVLAGCITALMGQHMNPFEAACAGVQLHAIAGDRVARRTNEAWVMAGDICDNLGLDI